MKYLPVFIILVLTACVTSQKIPIDSSLYSTSYNKNGELTKKTQMNSMILRHEGKSDGLILKSAAPVPNETRTTSQYLELYIWSDHIAEFKKILTDSLTMPISENPSLRTKLGAGPAIIKKQEINSEVYLILITEDGVLGFDKSNIEELLNLVNRVQSSNVNVTNRSKNIWGQSKNSQ